MGLKTIKEFAHKNNLGNGLTYNNGLFETVINLDSLANLVNSLNEALNTVYKVKGSTTVSGINSMTVGNAMVGNVYNLTDSGVITNGIGGELNVVKGDNVVYTENGWDQFAASLDLDQCAGLNISIENNIITAKGYVYNEDKKSFSEGDAKAIGLYSHAEGIILESLIQSMLYSYDSTSGNEDLLKLETDVVFANVGDYLRVYDVINENSFIFEVVEVDTLNKTIKVDKSFLDYGINPKDDNVELYALTGGFAIGGGSHSEGMSTSLGVMSHSEGHHTKAIGTMSHAEGNGTEAFGDDSHAEGTGTKAEGSSSHAEGNGSIAHEHASHVEGIYTIANNIAEHALGIRNISNTGTDTDDRTTLHSIGIGTASENKNAHEVMNNGDTFIIGIGDYNGTNPYESQTLQKVVNSKIDKEEGKHLSSNDYTNSDKEKVSLIESLQTIVLELQEKINSKEYSIDFESDSTTAQEINLMYSMLLKKLVGYNITGVNLQIGTGSAVNLTLTDNIWEGDPIVINQGERIYWDIVKYDESAPAVLGIYETKKL